MFRCPLPAALCLTASVMVFALAACSRKDESATVPAASAPAALPAPSDTPVAAPGSVPSAPADSSLAIKRGIAKVAGADAVFRACGETQELKIVDEGDATLAELFSEGTTSAYVEVYGERAPDEASKTGAEIFVLEQLLYAGAPPADGNCVPPPADAIVTARGNEPTWSVDISETKASWKQQGTADIALDTLQSQDAEGTVSYRAKAAGHELELLIDAQPCRDLVTDEYFAFAARAVLDGKEFRGCARVGK